MIKNLIESRGRILTSYKGSGSSRKQLSMKEEGNKDK